MHTHKITKCSPSLNHLTMFCKMDALKFNQYAFLKALMFVAKCAPLCRKIIHKVSYQATVLLSNTQDDVRVGNG